MPTLSHGTRSFITSSFLNKGQYDIGSPPQISRTNVFHQTPSSFSPLHPTSSTSPNHYQDSDASVVYSRKRSRATYNTESPLTKNELPWSSYEMMSASGDVDSPMPLVNTRYELAGGMDSQENECDYNYDLGRREGSRKHGRQDDGYNGSYNLPNLPTDANGRLRYPSQIKSVGVVSSAISKVWDFCTSAFRGFTAGGGTTYAVGEDSGSETIRNEKTYEDYLKVQNITPVPGRFPDEDFVEDYFTRPQDHTPPRPAKRRQISNENGAEKWVLVPEVGAQTPQRYPRKTTAIPRPIARGTMSRRSILSSRVSAISQAGPPALQANRPVSFATPTSKLRESMAPSPASIEARQWAEKKRKEEEEADESIRRFNTKLKAMIREGQAALATKVEIEDEMDEDNDMDDEGFVSGGNGW